MTGTPFTRFLAAFLAAQPPLWMGNVAVAQTLQLPTVRQPGEVESGVPPLAAPAESEVVSKEQRAPQAPYGVPPVDEPIDPEKYVCGSGDVLEVNFWGAQNFKLRVEVDLEGRAFVPRVGFFELGGKTLSQARRVLREGLTRHFPRLSFDMTLAEPRTFLVHVVDDVVRPGSYPARAVDRVASLVHKAGGFGPNASRRRVEIRRRDGTTIPADLLLFELTGDTTHNPFLLDGDVIRVPFEDVAATIIGGVNRPGRYELTRTRDLAELVNLAGGLATTATRQLSISIVRRAADDRQDHKLIPFEPGAVLPAAAVEKDDVVRIPSITDLQQSVIVVGAIAGASTPEDPGATRRLPFIEGDSVRMLLERVGGVGPLADLTNAYVIREDRTIPVDLNALLMLRNLSADRPVELGDTIVVPFQRRSIVVDGAVFRPGAYPYNPNHGIEQYLSLAGGRNRFAQPLSSVRVITPDGHMNSYAPDLKITPGSSLVVPERNFSRSEVVQIVLSAAGILLSGAAIALSTTR